MTKLNQNLRNLSLNKRSKSRPLLRSRASLISSVSRLKKSIKYRTFLNKWVRLSARMRMKWLRRRRRTPMEINQLSMRIKWKLLRTQKIIILMKLKINHQALLRCKIKMVLPKMMIKKALVSSRMKYLKKKVI